MQARSLLSRHNVLLCETFFNQVSCVVEKFSFGIGSSPISPAEAGQLLTELFDGP